MPSPPPSTHTAAELVVLGHEGPGKCGSIGGCAYYAELDGPGGPWDAEFLLRKGAPDGIGLEAGAGLPATIAAGTYRANFTKKLVSDEVTNGVRDVGPTTAECGYGFAVAPGQTSLLVQVEFEFDACSVSVRD